MVGSDYGIGYSGGGITGIFAGMCADHVLESMIPPEAAISGASGGMVGYILQRSTFAAPNPMQSYHPVHYPPDYSPELTLATLQSNLAPKGFTFWANAANFIPNITTASRHVRAPNAPEGVQAAEVGPTSKRKPTSKREMLSRDSTKGWWQDVIAALFVVGYGIPLSKVGHVRPLGDLAIGVGVVPQRAVPLKRNARGVLVDGNATIRFATLNTVHGQDDLRFDGIGVRLAPSQRPISPAVGAAWTSPFVSASILESSVQFLVERALELADKGLVISTTGSVDAAPPEVLYIVDGGMVDTTGAVALLQRQKKHILLNYVNNDQIAPVAVGRQSELASFAFLFGVDAKTDTMNSLPGPELMQVFDSELFPGVLANLTNGSRLLARLENVHVRANSYLGVASYVIEDLLIMSNARSQEFLDSFHDSKVAASVAADWPDRMPTGFGTLESNLLCEFERWKLLIRHKDAIQQFFGQ